MTDSSDPRSAAYARFYPPLAVVSVVISFQPILGGDFGTLWEMAGRPGGGPAVLGAILMGGLIALLGSASLRPVRSSALPWTIVAIAAVIVLMLVLKPGTGTRPPPLTSFGDAAVAIAVCAAVVATAHALSLRRR